jgi:S-adenosylmethionine synthetase
LITPYRAMTLEAAAGKNPVSHVGKLYNVTAHAVANAIVNDITDVASATCLLVSRIGRPVEQPELVDVRVRTLGYRSLDELRPRIDAIIEDELGKIPELWRRFVRGEICVY